MTQEIRFKLDEDFLKDLIQATGLKNGSELTKEAFTILRWLIDEFKNERLILSCSKDGSDLLRLTPKWPVIKSEKGE